MKLNPKLPAVPAYFDPDVKAYLQELVRALEFELADRSSNKEAFTLGSYTPLRDLSPVLTTAQLQNALSTLVQDLKRKGIVK